MARALYRNSIFYSSVRIIQDSFLPFNLQDPEYAMAPNGSIYVPAYGSLYSYDYSSAEIRLQHLFIHEMCHVWKYQAGMSVILRGLISWAVSYKYELHPPNTAGHTLLNKFGMEQQASIMADYWYVKNYGTIRPWTNITRMGNYQSQSAKELISLYEAVLHDFLGARSSCKRSAQTCRP